MARKKTSIDERPKRALIQIPPTLDDLLEDISRLTGVSVAKLAIDCVVRNHPRFLKMLDSAHEFHGLATGTDHPTKKVDQ